VVVRVQDVSRLEFEVAVFDRVVSVEMFEHVRNYDLLMHSIGRWLRRGGRLFVHIFCHRELLYPFETDGAGNWMGRHFFTGGLMPSADTLLWFQRGLRIEQRWLLDGTHYRHTANRWLEQQDLNRVAVLATLGGAYGADKASLWFHRWRMFWMACAETFGYGNGQEWLVAHYRFVREA
jgi:cyclopropane-fatty-acyl-phospholipid synthase